MAFIPSNLYQQSVPVPFVQQTVTGVPQVHLPVLYGYTSTTDTVATVSAANYFNSFANFTSPNITPLLGVGDSIYCVCSNGSVTLQVSSITNGITTTDVVLGPGSVNTASIQNGAVTTAKIANNAVTAAQIANATITTTQISAAAGIVGTQLANGTITATQVAANTLNDTEMVVGGISSLSLATNTIQYAKVPMTLAQFNGMYGAPFLLVAAAGAGTLITVNQMLLQFNYGSAAPTAGGAIAAQYSNTTHGGGVLATATIAAADLTGITASSAEMVAGALAINANVGTVNTGLYISNQTAAFATGTGGTVNIHIWYRIITV